MIPYQLILILWQFYDGGQIAVGIECMWGLVALIEHGDGTLQCCAFEPVFGSADGEVEKNDYILVEGVPERGQISTGAHHSCLEILVIKL